MRPLTRKLVRDLVRLRGQALTIGLVVAAGVASWIALRSTYDSLAEARLSTYERQAFGDVFADAVRAPRSIEPRLAAIEGVSRLALSARTPIRLRVEAESTPPTGVLVSLPAAGPAVDVPRLASGRLPDAASSDEALVLEAFARAHGRRPGASLRLIVNGLERTVRVVGTATSPEFLFAAAPGDLTPDERRFGVVWMSERGADGLAGMAGAFNHVALTLAPFASPEHVTSAVDRLLAPHGGQGAITRRDQPSHRAIEQELGQLRGMALVTPLVFLGVAAFLLHAVLGRLVELGRPEIAALRALGFTGREVASHYVALVGTIAGVGSILGAVLGARLGAAMMGLYAPYFHFPDPPYFLGVGVVASGVAVSLAAALSGALGAARRVARLHPAEAMQPPSPARYAPSWVERLPSFRTLAPTTRMIVREVRRHPGRLALSTLGLALAVAINVMGRFSADFLEEFVSLQFSLAMREDVAVTLHEPVDERAARSVATMPGVLRIEPVRVVPVELSNGPARRRRLLSAHDARASLRLPVDQHGRPVRVPARGLAIDDLTARSLDVRVGDRVRVRVLEGARRAHEIEVGAIFEGITALAVHASPDDVRRITGERALSGLVIATEPGREDDVVARLTDAPRVLAVTRRPALLAQFEALTGELLSTMTALLTAFASVIAVGVVYNDSRILLGSQARELASLRVLGMTRAEVSRILLGQIAIEVGLAIAPGLVLGGLSARLLMSTVDPEIYRFPTIISPATYVVSALVVVAAAALSALVVRHRIDHLDLVRVLKTRE